MRRVDDNVRRRQEAGDHALHLLGRILWVGIPVELVRCRVVLGVLVKMLLGHEMLVFRMNMVLVEGGVSR